MDTTAMTPNKTGLTNSSPDAKPASPAQQQQFDLLLGRARQMMEHTGQEWLQALKADPVQAAVTMGTQTIRSLAQMSEQAGQKVDPAVLLNVGLQFTKDVASVANAAGVVPDDKLGPYLQEVMTQSVMEYLKLDAKEGLLSPQDKQAGQGILAQLQAKGGGQDAEEAGENPQGEVGESPDAEAAEEQQEPPEPPDGDEQPGMLARMQRKGAMQ